MRAGPAPRAWLASAYSRVRSDATIARTPRATIGQPSSAKMPVEQQEDRAGGQDERHHRAQRERDVDRRQHEDEVRRPREHLVDRAARVPGDAADERADQDRRRAWR